MEAISSIRQSVQAEFEAVNQLIVEELRSDVGLVEDIGQYIVEAGGKRLRPLLVLLTGRALGDVNAHQLAFAAVIEFIHTATLLHDDVVDVSTLRRGRATANAKWGNAPSVLVGDFIYTRAFQLMVRIGEPRILELMADTTNQIAEGEVMQLQNAGCADTTEEQYFDVIARKTAVLFKAATEGAAILAGADDATVKYCADYGYHLGMAFQLADDALDYTGDSDTLGKNVGDDLAEGKPTLPLIHLMKSGDAACQAMVRRAITERTATDLAAIIDQIHNNGALQATLDCARTHQQSSNAAIDQAPSLQQATKLRQLAELAVNRDH